MPNVEIICIGNELLLGITENTNATWLCKEISKVGGKINRIVVIGDNLFEIAKSIDESYHNSPDWIITTGGLGPTYDDKTIEGLALFDNQELIVNQEALEMLEKSYKRRKMNIKLTEARIKMAKIPGNAKPINNPIGNAPAVLIKKGNTKIMCLPGVPEEMKSIFKESILEKIRDISIEKIQNIEFEITGVSEAILAPFLLDVAKRNYKCLYIKTHPKRYLNDKISNIIIQMIFKGKEKEVKEVSDLLRVQLIEEIEKLGGLINKINENDLNEKSLDG